MVAISLLKTWGFLLIAATAVARPVVVESLDETPEGWEESSSPAPDKSIELSIGLESEDHLLLERTLSKISDPSHANYGKHLSRDAAKALLHPSRAATESVKRWLSDAGVPEHHIRDEGQWLHIRTTVGQADSLLSTRFGIFARDDEQVVRTRQYSVPIEVRDHITTIQPTTFFPSERKARAVEDLTSLEKREEGHEARAYGNNNDGNHGGNGPIDLQQCKAQLTPACLRKIYKMPLRRYPRAHRKSEYGIIGFLEQNAQFSDLEEFLKRFAPDLKGSNFSVSLVNGGLNQQTHNVAQIEANMDIQYAIALADKVPVRFISVGGMNQNLIPDLDFQAINATNRQYPEPWLELLQYLLNLPNSNLPKVISLSYGSNEQHISKSYARQVCNMFGQLGTRGVSVIAAAGNTGPGFSCKSNDGKNKTKFLPTFPGSCPYVTSVGGTEGNGPEIAWSRSSGGFSEVFSRPWWQEQTVKSYLKKHGNEWKGYYNPNGRAYPDVAALAWNHQIMLRGNQTFGGGTSVAAPTFGAMIALINNERFKKGKPPMGFLNPWLYKTGKAGFTDITQGKSVGCTGESYIRLPSPVISNAGWKAVKGWDPVTGWGTPLFDRLQRLTT
ncbi:Peptidase S53 domain-containing protein [Fusarium keratoplasticum]|uniref:Peptidase S53 domain-containing protein n=1 Tax=Fusarium keratoplasticum TaxID=1328300 RepID=A0ACC0QZX3_9HYPO|nr:Peptidase S53 domain-containing protein [Fusarium keratoplasticum]KAI8669497.1 Peptidase S53 domain-containing protein [Fusarium keratoplasticum]